MTKYNKLVRDNIPEIIAAKGGAAKTHVAEMVEFWAKLKEKLGEEVTEFLESESAEEIADILEVIDAILVYKGFDKEEVKMVQQKKREERGAFQKRIILEES